MLVADATGLPIGLHVDSATPHEITLAPITLASIRVPRKGPGRPRTNPKELIADKAYSSRAFRSALRHRGIKPTIPTARLRPGAKRKPGRPVVVGPNFKHRWTVERTFAWLYAFRRLRIRYERLIVNFRGFCLLACAMLALDRLLK